MPATLTQNQVDRFNRDGYLVAEDAVTPDQLFPLRAEIGGLGRGKPRPCRTLWRADHRPPAAVRHGHRAHGGAPGAAPGQQSSDIFKAYFEVMSDARTVDMVAASRPRPRFRRATGRVDPGHRILGHEIAIGG